MLRHPCIPTPSAARSPSRRYVFTIVSRCFYQPPCFVYQNAAPGALTIDAMCQEGTFVIDNISYYSDAKTGTELTAEADWKRRGYYLGPQVSADPIICVGRDAHHCTPCSSTRSTFRSRMSSTSFCRSAVSTRLLRTSFLSTLSTRSRRSVLTHEHLNICSSSECVLLSFRSTSAGSRTSRTSLRHERITFFFASIYCPPHTISA